MNESLVITLSEWLVAAAALGGIGIIITAGWYDLRSVVSARRRARIIPTLRAPRQPSITILVYAKNHETSIQRCLTSIRQSRYKHYSVVVIDNKSTDHTQRSVRQFQKTHPTMPLKLYAKRIMTTETQAYRDGYAKQQTSDFVVTIDGTMQLPSTFLKETAAHFITSPQLTTLVCQVAEAPVKSISRLSRHWRHLSDSVLLKTLSATSALRVLQAASGRCYRSDAFITASTTRRQHIQYASTLVIDTEMAEPIRLLSSRHIIMHHFLRALGAIAHLLFIGLVTYFFITAAELRNHTFLSLGWLLVTVWLLNAVWSSEGRSIRSKIETTLTIPFAFFILYVLSGLHLLTQLGVVLRRLMSKATYYLHHLVNQARLELYTTHY